MTGLDEEQENQPRCGCFPVHKRHRTFVVCAVSFRHGNSGPESPSTPQTYPSRRSSDVPSLGAPWDLPTSCTDLASSSMRPILRHWVSAVSISAPFVRCNRCLMFGAEAWFDATWGPETGLTSHKERCPIAGNLLKDPDTADFAVHGSDFPHATH